jgi:Mannosyl-glycoprotein endo-beta-N-acetylglucosaminidase
MPSTKSLRYACLCLFGVAGAALGTAAVQSVEAARRARMPDARAVPTGTPEIRVSATNAVPACIKPDALMQTLKERNPRLEEKFFTIAHLYKQHGEKLRIRWDYAFYQMIHETNALSYTGDVKAKQNNFAGLGATGGGVRGESFADVPTGVLAHLQHLVAYSGEKVENPAAQRTREHQDGIVFKSQKLGRPVRFADLTNRWAMDSKYTRHLEATADRFYSAACKGADQMAAPAAAAAPAEVTRKARRGADAAAAPVVPAQVPAPVAETAEGDGPNKRKGRRGQDLAKKAIDDGRVEDTRKSGLGVSHAAAVSCNVMAASFGGNVTLLIRSEAADKTVNFTALGVEGGAEDLMADSYMKVHAPGGRVAARFKNREEAVAHAYALCDSGKP